MNTDGPVDGAGEILWTPERAAIRFLSDPAPYMVWMTDSAGGAVYVNPQWSAFSGQTQEEALGDGWQAVLHPDERPLALAGYRKALEDRLPFHTRYRIRYAHGKYGTVLATAHPLFDRAGRYVGYVGAHAAQPATQPIGKGAAAGAEKSFILSRRERAVLTWVAAGLTAEEIGNKLEIAPRTVEFHIHSSARKLRSSNRVQTVAKAAVYGEIDLRTAIGL